MKSDKLDEGRFVKCHNTDRPKTYQMEKYSDICPACGEYTDDGKHEVTVTERRNHDFSHLRDGAEFGR